MIKSDYNRFQGTHLERTKLINYVVPVLTFTFAASNTVIASASCLTTLSIGMYIWNSTNDTNTSSLRITNISADGLTITLSAAYAGTIGAGKTATINTLNLVRVGSEFFETDTGKLVWFDSVNWQPIN